MPSGLEIPGYIVVGAVVTVVAAVATVALVADDATGVGVADDVALPVTVGGTIWGANTLRLGVSAAAMALGF